MSVVHTGPSDRSAVSFVVNTAGCNCIIKANVIGKAWKFNTFKEGKDEIQN